MNALEDDNQEINPQSEYVTLKEIKERFGLKDGKAREMIRSAYFPSLKLGKSYILIPRKAFEAFMSNPDRIVEYHLKTYGIENDNKQK